MGRLDELNRVLSGTPSVDDTRGMTLDAVRDALLAIVGELQSISEGSIDLGGVESAIMALAGAVNISVEAPVVNVEPARVNVSAPAVEVAAPVVSVDAPSVEVLMPDNQVVQFDIHRDNNGLMKQVIARPYEGAVIEAPETAVFE